MIVSCSTLPNLAVYAQKTSINSNPITSIYGKSNFYRYLDKRDKEDLQQLLSKYQIDTSQYLIVNNFKDYMKHLNNQIGGRITEYSFKRYQGKIIQDSISYNIKKGKKLQQPILYIFYVKQPEEDYISISITTKQPKRWPKTALIK